MLDPSLSVNAVAHFREFFRDLTAEKIDAMDDEAREDYGAACWAAFQSFGDPRTWIGFDQLSDFARVALNRAYENWPGPEATQRQIDDAKRLIVIPKGSQIH